MRAVLRLLIALAWSLATCHGAAAAAATNSTGIFEVDLVFPRNETYAPSPLMPIVFGFKNAELGRILNPTISFDLWSEKDNLTENYGTIWYMRWANWSNSEPFFKYGGWTAFNTETHWRLNWRLAWSNCTENSVGGFEVSSHSAGGWVRFTTKNSSQPADLAAVTNNKTCPSSQGGVSFNITDVLNESPEDSRLAADYCAVLAPSTVTPSPCAMKIDVAAASSISSAITSKACLATASSINCTVEDESVAQQLTVGGAACVAAALGALVYILH